MQDLELRNNYLSLYEAIFAQAVEDDLKNEPKRLLEEISEEVEMIRENGLGEIFEVKEAIENHKAELKNAIRQRVYDETFSWPKRADDSAYKKRYNEIKQSIIEQLT